MLQINILNGSGMFGIMFYTYFEIGVSNLN